MIRTRRASRVAGVALAGLVLVLGLPGTSGAAPQSVSISDNRFNPQETRINPGDTVIWSNNGSRVHDVTADDGSFKSEPLQRGQSFRHTFQEEGFYYYFCSFHGSRRKVGMWGLVIVGNPDPATDPYKDLGSRPHDARPKLRVPQDFKSIQKAVNVAEPGATILIGPGVYKTSVTVTTPDLIIRGVDRFRTILHGQDKRQNGIVVDGTRNVKIMNLTVRNYLGNGIYINNTVGYTVNKVDAIKGRTYGIYAFDSTDGVIKNSFAYGSGDGAIYIGQCLPCSAIIENVVATWSYLGYSGTNATGVIIRDSVFRYNGAGIVPNTLSSEEYGPNRGTLIFNNKVFNNNYDGIPPAGISELPVAIPFGTGIWLFGTENNVAMNNEIYDHNSYGVLVSVPFADSDPPMNNTVVDNWIRNSDADEDGYGYDLAWDGSGADNCFSDNNIKGATGPPEIQTIYACANRPFAGSPYPPVLAHLGSEAATGHQEREVKEPPNPKRPKCQKGAPGCHRH